MTGKQSGSYHDSLVLIQATYRGCINMTVLYLVSRVLLTLWYHTSD